MRTRKVKEHLFRRYGFEVDQKIAAHMHVDVKLTYVPINYHARLGKAKTPTWRQGFRMLFAVFGFVRRYNPLVVFGLVAVAGLILETF